MGARGRLVVVGTGIQTVGQLTHEARAWLQAADEVLHLLPDPVGEAIVDRLCAGRHRSLKDLYVEGQPRREAYDAMVHAILEPVRAGRTVCAALYGHPGVFSLVPHEAIALARAEGHEATMLPGISAEDCLFADLGVDPAASGCLSYEATDFVINQRAVDPSAALVLWQIGKVGVFDHSARRSSVEALTAVVDKLLPTHPAGHPVVLYEAATQPKVPPSITELELGALPDALTRPTHTLYVGPAAPVARDPRYEHLRP